MKVEVGITENWMNFIVVDQYGKEITAKSFDDETHKGEFILFNSTGNVVCSKGKPITIWRIIEDAKLKCLAIEYYFSQFWAMVEKQT